MNDDAVVQVQAPSRGRVAALLSDLWYRLWKLIFWIIFKLFFRITVEGREHEPTRGPFIAAGNHASAVDPLVVGISLRNKAFYMGKEELFSVPVVGPWVTSMGTFPVRRGQPDRKAIRRSIHILESGDVLVMFPEGTRSPDGRLQKPEPGAAMIALRTGAPVLPVAVINSHRILPKGSRRPRFEKVTVRMGPPVRVPRVEGRLDHKMMEEWGQRIIEAIEDLLPPEQKRPVVNSES